MSDISEKSKEKLSQLWQFVLDYATITDEEVRFGPIYSLDKNNSVRVWSIYASFTQDNDKIRLTEQHVYATPSLPIIGSYWTVSGIEGGNNITSEQTAVTQGKNIGKKNQTSPLVQTLLVVKSEWEGKIKDGYIPERDQLIDANNVSFEKLAVNRSRGPHPWRVHAMLLHPLKYAEIKNKTPTGNWKKVKYPCYIQPKLDGVLTTMVYHPQITDVYTINKTFTSSSYYVAPITSRLAAIYGDDFLAKLKVDKFTRTGETIFSCGAVNMVYGLVAHKYPGLYIVGEMYKHGKALQDISGIMRTEKDNVDHDSLEFHVFDCYYIDKPRQPFKERISILNTVCADIKTVMGDVNQELGEENETQLVLPIKLVPTKVVKTVSEIEKQFSAYLEKSMEGAVIRNADSIYEFGINMASRSYGTMKLKLRPDSEWPVVNFTSGTTGKDRGAIIWICGVGNSADPDKQKTFNVVPNATLEYRKKLYDYLRDNREVFAEKIAGKLLTIEYSIISNEQTPQQPKALRFRDSDVEEFLKLSIVGGFDAAPNPAMDSLILAGIKRIAKNHPPTYSQISKYLDVLGVSADKYTEIMDVTGMIQNIYENSSKPELRVGNHLTTQLKDVVSQYMKPTDKVLYCTGYYERAGAFREEYAGRYSSLEFIDHNTLGAFKASNPVTQYDLIILNYYLQKINADQFYGNIRSYLNTGGRLIIIDQNAFKILPELKNLYRLTDIVRFMLHYLNTCKTPECSAYLDACKKLPPTNYQFAEDVINALTNITLIETDTPPMGSLNNNYVLVYTRK